MASKPTGIEAAWDALEHAGLDVKNRATGDAPPVIALEFDQFNQMVKCGGIPRRRYTQIYGEPHQGKTLLATHIAVMAQQQDPDRLVLYMDTENSFDRAWAEINGLDFSKFYLIQGNTAETVLETAVKAMQTGKIGLVVIDTIGQMLEEKGKSAAWSDDSEGGKRQVGAFQKLVARFCRVASDYMVEHDIAVVGINQTYTNIGVKYGSNVAIPGGKSWKFNITMDIRVRVVEYIYDDKSAPPIGLKMAIDVRKNKLGGMASTDDSNHLAFYFGAEGRKRAWAMSLLEKAVRLSIVKIGGSWYTWSWNNEEVRKWQGRPRAIAELISDDALSQRLASLVDNQEKLQGGVTNRRVSKPATAIRKSPRLSSEEES